MSKWKVYYRRTSVVAVVVEANSRIEAMNLAMDVPANQEQIVTPSKHKEFMSAEELEK